MILGDNMKHYVYKTKDGKEVMTFAMWVDSNGTTEDIEVHYQGSEEPTQAFSKLLNKYLEENKVETVSIYEDEELIEGPNPIILSK
jgi:hypothetical protein